MNYSKLSLLVVMLLSFQAISAQNLVTNGSFATDLSSWTTTGNVGYFGICGGVAAYSGANTTPNGVISQDIVPISGNAYQVSVDYSGHNASQMLRLDIIDNVSNTVLLTQTLVAAGVCPTGTLNFSTTITAPSADLTVQFTDISTATFNQDFYLVDVSITGAAPVPTMSQWGLILLALSFMCLAAVVLWRRQYNAGKARMLSA
jgi:PKD repeat protein